MAEWLMATYRGCPQRLAMSHQPSAMACSPQSTRARDVVPRAGAHRANLLREIVERLVARVGVELRCLDDEQRRAVVVKEEVVVRLVQLAHVVVVGLQGDGFRVHAPAVD